jgi:hypothetical protein
MEFCIVIVSRNLRWFPLRAQQRVAKFKGVCGNSDLVT